MSAAAAATDAPAPKGKKKLIIIIAAALLVLGIGGGGAAVFLMKKKAAEAAAAEADDEGGGSHAKAKSKSKAKDDHKTAPVFMPLEPFVVNLADKDTDRFAQIGITLEVDDAKAMDDLKAYMPAIRNGILLVLSQKSSKDLMDRAGKEALAIEVMRESVRPLGFEVPEEEPEEKADESEKPKKKKKKKEKEADPGPVKHVHFSSFIIQ